MQGVKNATTICYTIRKNMFPHDEFVIRIRIFYWNRVLPGGGGGGGIPTKLSSCFALAVFLCKMLEQKLFFCLCTE